MGLGGGNGYNPEMAEMELKKYDDEMRKKCVRDLLWAVPLAVGIICLASAVYQKYQTNHVYHQLPALSQQAADSPDSLEGRVER